MAWRPGARRALRGGRVDPAEEALARRVIGDDAVNQALADLDAFPPLEDQVEPDLQQLVVAANARRGFVPEG